MEDRPCSQSDEPHNLYPEVFHVCGGKEISDMPQVVKANALLWANAGKTEWKHTSLKYWAFICATEIQVIITLRNLRLNF